MRSSRTGRIARLRERWHNASLKTSFMVYMLGFLVAALGLSTATASVFAALHNEVTADAYEISGPVSYTHLDVYKRQTHPARRTRSPRSPACLALCSVSPSDRSFRLR